MTLGVPFSREAPNCLRDFDLIRRSVLCDDRRTSPVRLPQQCGGGSPRGMTKFRRTALTVAVSAGRIPNGRSWVHSLLRCRCSESSVDDLRTWRGVVLGRAVTTLRSVETQPFARGFVLIIVGNGLLRLRTHRFRAP